MKLIPLAATAVLAALALPAVAHAQAAKPAAPAAMPAGDAKAGAAVFRRCVACHSLTPGRNGVGPSLAGIVGKKSGGVPNFRYSAGYQGGKITWNEATLFAYLADPKKIAGPTSRMAFRLPSPQDRANVIAFLKTNPTK
jgi:cytochrome c2